LAGAEKQGSGDFSGFDSTANRLLAMRENEPDPFFQHAVTG
jgi:hypothetical protein